MSKIFADFLKTYSNSDNIFLELDKYVGANQASLKNKSGGSSTLAIRMHETMQKALFDIFVIELNTNNTKLTADYEESIRANLVDRLSYDIKSHSEISESSNLTSEDVANHFIEVIFNPLLEQSKQLNELLNNIEVQILPSSEFTQNLKPT